MPKIKYKQIVSANANRVIEASNSKFLTNAEKTVLTDITTKGSVAIRKYEQTTASLKTSAVAGIDYRTALQSVNFPAELPNVPKSILTTIRSDRGNYKVMILSMTNTGMTYKICTPIGTTARVHIIEFVVLL